MGNSIADKAKLQADAALKRLSLQQHQSSSNLANPPAEANPAQPEKGVLQGKLAQESLNKEFNQVEPSGTAKQSQHGTTGLQGQLAGREIHNAVNDQIQPPCKENMSQPGKAEEVMVHVRIHLGPQFTLNNLDANTAISELKKRILDSQQ